MPELETQEDLHQWLAGLHLQQHAQTLFNAGWHGARLRELDREELADLGIPKADRGPIMLAVEALRQGDAPPTLADDQAPSYTPALSAEAIAQCQALARTPPAPWVDAIADDWPGPIAHEYERLRQLLEQGQIVPAILQLKDLTEVLIKFSALVMARDLLAHGDAVAAEQVRGRFFPGGALSLGHWIGTLRDVLAPEILRLSATTELLVPELGHVFVGLKPNGKRKNTSWLNTLESLVSWRNETIGHGAFALEPRDYLPRLEQWIEKLNKELATQSFWSELALCGDEEPAPLELRGWQSIHHWHHGSASLPHPEQERALYLQRGERRLALAPLIMLRRCRICDKQDVFLYDSPAGSKLQQGFILLDYLTGHRLALPAHLAGALSGEAQATASLIGPDPSAALPAPDQTLDEDIGHAALNALFEAKLLEARYLPPDAPRAALKAFLEQHTHGIFWLIASGHTGKSVFVHGLAEPAAVGDKPLLADTAVVALHIRREYRAWPEQLRWFLLEQVLHKTFGRAPGQKGLPELKLPPSTSAGQTEPDYDPPSAFLEVLQAMMRLKPARIARLVICLDGLDELPPSAEGEVGIADFIPRPEDLPEDCYLLLTSRPLPDCPPRVRATLSERVTEGPHASLYRLDLDTASAENPAITAYHALLQRYFDRELRERLKSDLAQALSDCVTGCTELIAENDLGRELKAAGLPGLEDFAKAEWKRLAAGLTLRSPKDAPSLFDLTLRPVLERYQNAFAAVRARANDRFLYVAHLTTLLRDGQLALEGIDALPAGSGLYAHYLRQLETALSARDSVQPRPAMEAATEPATASAPAPDKFWDFAQRLLLTLAAAEQAHAEIESRMPPSVREDLFHGVPLGILATLLDEPPGSIRLIFNLYSIKTILAAWRGEDSRDARYALGLKDFVATIAALWPEELRARHRQLAAQTREALADAWETLSDPAPLEVWRIQYLLGHEWLAGDEALEGAALKDPGFDRCLYSLGSQARERARYPLATRWWSLNLACAEERTRREDSNSARNDLAMVYSNRGLARRDGGNDLAGALRDYDAAIALLETLRGGRPAPTDDWPPAWANDLASAYSNRGLARHDGNDLAGAMRDFNAAIVLRETLRGDRPAPTDDWPPAWANDLAGAYNNRGMARSAGNDLAGALRDYDAAIALQVVLRGDRPVPTDDWPPAWANDLSNTYSNRGNARRDGNDLAGALRDFNDAIALRETLRGDRPAPTDDWPPAWVNDLAMVYGNRGNARRDGNDLAGALQDYDAAIALRETLRGDRPAPTDDWPPAWANDLASAYSNRGLARHDVNDLAGALRDYDAAIALQVALRGDRPAPTDDWPPAWANELALVYSNRGNARSDGNDLAGALQDYDAAITLRETLRGDRPAPTDDWPPAWANELALVYSNRGLARHNGNDLAGALRDFNDAIALMETLRGGRPAPTDNWPAAWANELTVVYSHRGNARRGGNDLAGALRDFNDAIALGETLRGGRPAPTDDWPPAWANYLARAYSNRGNARCVGKDLAGALQDCNAAIALGETLRGARSAPTDDWPPAWANDLGLFYNNRGAVFGYGKDLAGALQDFNAAIALGETLRGGHPAPTDDWPPAWANDLAGAYSNRGLTLHHGNDQAGALRDHDAAITLMETLRGDRTLPTEDWRPAWAGQLAESYKNRGVIRAEANLLDDAIEDWSSAAVLRAMLVAQGNFDMGVDLVRTMTWILKGYCDLKDWHSMATDLIDFLQLYPMLQNAWTHQKHNGEPPWQEEAKRIVQIMHQLTTEQRAQLLAACGDQAEAVTEALGWQSAGGD